MLRGVLPIALEEAAILTIDGVGEWATARLVKDLGSNYALTELSTFMGLLYSSFTYFLGFKVNSGEYGLMGLVSYGVSSTFMKKPKRSFIHS